MMAVSVRRLLAVFIAATAIAAAAPFAALAGSVPFKAPPEGTVIEYKDFYNDFTLEVTDNQGMDFVVRRNLPVIRFYTKIGIFATTGPDLYSSWPSGEFLTYWVQGLQNEKSKIHDFWPLNPGKSVTYRLFQGSETDYWMITLTVKGPENVVLGNQIFETILVEERGQETPGLPGRTFVAKHWYHPATGLIVKFERKWAGDPSTQRGLGRYPKFVAGQIEAFSLKSAKFPNGKTAHQIAALANPPSSAPAPASAKSEFTSAVPTRGNHLNLPPAKYRGLPVGTRVRFRTEDGVNRYTVTRSEGYEIVYNYRLDNSYWTFFGHVGRVGGTQYTDSRLGEINVRDTDSLRSAWAGLWPLEVGNKVDVRIREGEPIPAFGRDWRINIEVLRTEHLVLNGKTYPTYVIEEKGHGGQLVSGSETPISPRVAFTTTHWYHPESGLILQKKRKSTGDSHSLSPPRQFVLIDVEFPEGTADRSLIPVEDTNAWQAAVASTTPEGVQKYLDLFPHGPHATQAHALIAKLKIEIAAEEVRRVDLSAWEAARGSGRINRVQAYIKGFPQGRYVNDARTLITALVEQKRQEKARRLEMVQWQMARDSGDVGAIQAYIDSYPESSYVEEAAALVASLERQRLERMARELEDAQWQTALRGGRIEHFRSYMKAFPQGRFVKDAASGIAKIKQAEKEAKRLALRKRKYDKALAEGRKLETKLTDLERRYVQWGLKELGFYKSIVDGDLGFGTRIAIKNYQKKQGQFATGYLGSNQIVALIDIGKARYQVAQAKRLNQEAERLRAEKDARKQAELERQRKAKQLTVQREAEMKAETERRQTAQSAATSLAKSALLQQLATLKTLRDQGLIDEETFKAQQKLVLKRMFGGPQGSAPASPAPARSATPDPKTADIPDIDFGKYHALIIGNNNYQFLPKLKTAANDARAIAQVLRDDYGFEVTLLLNAERVDMIDALDHLTETLGANDNLLIYYAGHGYLDDDTDQGYWLPVNARNNRRSRWFSNATLTNTLRAIQAKHVMVVADSCFSGTLTRGANLGIRAGDYWRRMAKKVARVALVSGGLEPVEDGSGLHSPFAKAFLAALKGNEAIIDGTELFNKVRRPVMVATKQTPEYSDVRGTGHDGGDFLFVRKK